LDEEKIKCVECHTDTMKFIDLGDYVESLSAKQCSTCSGIFISFDLLEKAIMHYGLKRKKIPSKIDMPKEEKRNKDNLYSCPICKQTMKRFVYKISSSVLIDKCENHGVWLNHGELKVLIEWKQAFKSFKDKEKNEEAYRKYGLKKTKSSYTYQRETSTATDRFFEWLMGV
jgi:Zn-finger nucleic acid-binding protein